MLKIMRIIATWKVSSVGIAHSQADTIDRYRAFVYCDVAALCHLLVKSIPESKVIASFRILYMGWQSGPHVL